MTGKDTRTESLLVPDWNPEWEDETRAIRAGQIRSQEQEHSETLYLTSSFVFKSAEEAARRFAGELPGNIYSRFTNPTVSMFERRLAALEGGERAVATASGMAAIVAVGMAVLKAGDHVLCSQSVFGTTTTIFQKYFAKFGVEVDFVPLADSTAWEAAMRPNTRLLFVETPSNPLCEIGDIRALAAIAEKGGALLVVDNCFCTPVLQKPLQLGAHLAVHSATKFLDGQGRCVGGAVVGNDPALMEEIFGVLRSGGLTMSPFNAWVFLKGLELLPLRMRAHCENGEAVARWLRAQSWVEKVFYPGLEDHPGHDIARRQQKGYGGVVSFRVRGGREEAWQFIDQSGWFSITANLGDVKTTITHPASTTHGRLSPEVKTQAGITENLIRLCVGLESREDIIEQLERAAAHLA